MLFAIIVGRMGGFYQLRQRYLNSTSRFQKKIYAFIHKWYQHETNSYLPMHATIEGPVNFLHGTYGIFISGGSKIGKNCTIFQQVTIGSNMLIDSKNMGSPTIGDNCLIGAGAKIIGNVRIGNNCRIGANAVVASDLPDNSVCVLGKPVITKEYLVNHIYQYSNGRWGYQENGRFVIEKNEERIQQLNTLL